jgi:FlaA1/EpsC-like NDP-sugar epimerase
MAVRFGNVLGSNGSLVQILKRQILKGGPVTITHKDITRFFMTIPEAVGLVLVAAQQAEGALCILDMGEPLSVDNLAREMISLYGLIPGTDIEIVYTGLRPGEKMYEELFTKNESNKPSTHPRIFIAKADKVTIDVEKMLSVAENIIESKDDSKIESFLKEFVEGYTPDETLKKLRK